MSHPSHINAMQKAARRGFYVRLIFVSTEDPLINVGRVENRVAKGGHGVPRDKILSRYASTMQNSLARAADVADEALVFDNSIVGHMQQVCHVMGKFVRCYDTRGITWPEVYLLSELRARGYTFEAGLTPQANPLP